MGDHSIKFMVLLFDTFSEPRSEVPKEPHTKKTDILQNNERIRIDFW